MVYCFDYCGKLHEEDSNECRQNEVLGGANVSGPISMGPDEVCLLEFKSISNAYCHNSTLKALCRSDHDGDTAHKCYNLFGDEDPNTDEACNHVKSQNHETFSAKFQMQKVKEGFT